MLISTPPLLPGLIAASVCKRFIVPSVKDTSRFFALTTPVVTDWPYPNALPIATTSSPTFKSSELPSVATLIFDAVESLISFIFTEITARSALESVQTTVALAVVSSANPTVREVASDTT